MQTHNLKLPKNYRDTASNFYIKVGIGLIAILIILNVTLLILFLKETKNNRNALQVLQETSKTLALLQDSLGKMDMQKAFVHLADARRQIAARPVSRTRGAAGETGCRPPRTTAANGESGRRTQGPTGETAGRGAAAGARESSRQKLSRRRPRQPSKRRPLSYRPAKRRRRLSGRWPESMHSSARRKASSSICSNSRMIGLSSSNPIPASSGRTVKTRKRPGILQRRGGAILPCAIPRGAPCPRFTGRGPLS